MLCPLSYSFFFFNDTATTEIYTLSYTTLFRSLGRRRQCAARRDVLPARTGFAVPQLLRRGTHPGGRRKGQARRSEEHTSELQSHLNLVCRLLLEKKKPKPDHTSRHRA